MEHELLRLECMKLAASEGLKGDGAIKRAQEIFEFLRYGRDEVTEVRRIVAGAQNEHVTVRAVGSDVHDIIAKRRPPNDYVPE